MAQTNVKHEIAKYRREVLENNRFWVELFKYYPSLCNVPLIRKFNVIPFLADCEEYQWISDDKEIIYGRGIGHDLKGCTKSYAYLKPLYVGLQNHLLKCFPEYRYRNGKMIGDKN